MLYAPKSGTELRDQIRGEAQEQLDRAAAQWERALKQVQQNIADLQAEVKGYIEQGQSGGSTPAA
jgi:gas vesicle protein